MKQRIIALAVALLMVLTMVPVTGNATYAAGQNDLSVTSTECTHEKSLDNPELKKEVRQEATCQQQGITRVWCACGKQGKDFLVPKSDHKYVEVREVKREATCTEDGLAYNWTKCTWCGKKKSNVVETIPATGHTEVVEKGYAATCTTDGKTDKIYCSVCNEVLTKQEIIPGGHTAVTLKGYAATCTTAGLSNGSECSVCGTVIKKQQAIAAKGHQTKTVKGHAATCSKEGLTDGTKCGACGIMLEEQQIIPKLAHKIVYDKAVEATCTTDGKTMGKHCSVCKEVLTEQEIIPASHTVVVDAAVAETCDTDGKTEGKHCSVCNKVLVKQETIKAYGHDVVITPAVALTCTTDGMTIGKHCSTCKEVLLEQYVIYTFGHNTREKVVKKATKKAKGLVKSTCAVCNKALGERSVPKIGTVKLSRTLYVYDLTTHTPEVIINDANGNPIDEDNYTLTVPAERIYTGKHTYTVKFKNEYSGTVTMVMKIAPKTPEVLDPIPLKKGMTVKWGKLYGKATGYEVMVATNSKFTKNKKTVTIKNLNTTSKKITGLKGKTNYWVKVRGYKTAGKEKIYSEWSKVMTVKTK